MHAATDRIELAQRRAVQIDLGDHIALGHRQVHRGGHADARLDHAADHARHTVDAGDVGNADRVGQAAGLHQLDVDDVGRTLLDQVHHLAWAEHTLVGHHRRVDAVGDVHHVPIAGTAG
ncbi:hypothetical protein G6F31_021002 [Rhizopus arrhizus]|nr:hypothetical protein G6F31_021002 [Rhizopus arrhizus]